MVNICITSYYGLREALLYASDELQKFGHNVLDFPLYKYYADSHDKRDDYLELLVEFIKTNNIHVVYWWYVNIPSNDLKIIKDKTNTKFMFFNWDEPYNWLLCDLPNKAYYFDCVFITCKETRQRYIDHGTKKAVYCLPGFNPLVHHLIKTPNSEEESKYMCDISFSCTDLYADEHKYPNQYINRKYLIDTIYNNQSVYNYSFHIYGPEHLKELYPLSYKGFINYNDSGKLFNYSKINLCSHVLSNKEGYINERVILIGGSGGLLLVDNVKGIEKIFDINSECIILDKTNFIKQIINILFEYDKYIDHKLNLNKKCMTNYTYQHFAELMHKEFLSNIQN